MSGKIVIVGASLAGCSTAVLLARAGHQVILIERSSSAESFKRVCTHLIQNTAISTLKRLDLLQRMLDAGAKPSKSRIWFRSGWIQVNPDEQTDRHGPTWNLNLRREVLDPMVRDLAKSTPGIELCFGTSLESLEEKHGRVVGVHVTRAGKREHLPASLVIGADGRHSKSAELAKIPTREYVNIRGGWGAYYKNVRLGNGADTYFWLLEPDVAYVFPTDSELTLLAAITTQENLSHWKKDIEGNHLRLLRTIPDGPDLSRAERVSDFFGMLKAPGYYRNPAYRRGMALVGDAALTTDFIWGEGCSSAFRSAELLADAIGSATECSDHSQFDSAIKKYHKNHYRALFLPHTQNTTFSKNRKVEFTRRIVFEAARSSPAIRQMMFEVQTGRTSGLSSAFQLFCRSILHQLGRTFRQTRSELAPNLEKNYG